MRFPIMFTARSTQGELMDDPELPAALLEKAMADLKTVNRWLGGYSVTLKGLKPFLLENGKGPRHILDIGCGNGEFLRFLSGYCRQNAIPVRLTGWDINENHIEAARQAAAKDNIRFEQKNILDPDARPDPDTIIVCNLFLHHFTDDQIIALVKGWMDSGCKAIVINDLHRNALAYYLFQLFGLIFMRSQIAKHDGRISIQRGFTRKGLEMLFDTEESLEYRIRWKWAFRYLCVLRSKNCL